MRWPMGPSANSFALRLLIACRLSQVFMLVLPNQEIAEIMAGMTYGLSVLFSGNLIPINQVRCGVGLEG